MTEIIINRRTGKSPHKSCWRYRGQVTVTTDCTITSYITWISRMRHGGNTLYRCKAVRFNGDVEFVSAFAACESLAYDDVVRRAEDYEKDYAERYARPI